MIFRGYGWEFSCMMPIGRQWASGLSLLLSAFRFATSSAAHGWYGALWSGMLAPIFPKTNPEGSGGALRTGGSSAAGRAPAVVRLLPAAGTHPVQGTVSQTPDRSGFPSGVRGGGAS